MRALPQSTLPDHIRNEVARLMRAGIPLLPLGGGGDGKSPLTREWAGPALPLAQVLAPMHRTGSRTFGVRLDRLAVLDCDTADAAIVADLEARFGTSPVQVRTPRGMRLYYRAGGPVLNLRAEGLPVDVKTGRHSSVVGPLSERRDGGTYTPVLGLLGVDSLPAMKCTTERLATRAIANGHRHDALVRKAIWMVEYVDTAEELMANLIGVRDDLCENPDTFPDSELRAIATWAWKCHLEGRIFHGCESEARLNRSVLDALRPLPNGPDALALLLTLIDKHGHFPGRRFALSHPGIVEAGLTKLSRRSFLGARRTLESLGLIRLVEPHLAGSRGQLFVLTRMRPAGRPPEAIADFLTERAHLVAGSSARNRK